MSHSRIFVLKDRDTDIDDVFKPDYEELISACPAADYIDEDISLSDDIDRFNSIYGNIVTEKDGRYFVKRKELMRALEESKAMRIKVVQNKLSHKSPEELSSTDIYLITEALEDKNSFLFGLNEHSYLTTSVYFLDDLQYCKDDTLEIVASYDYHF